MKEHTDYIEDEGVTDYDRFIDEELQESLTTTKETLLKPKEVVGEIMSTLPAEYPIKAKPLVREEPDISSRDRQIESHEPVHVVSANAEDRQTVKNDRMEVRKRHKDICDETCPLVNEQKGKRTYYNIFKKIFKTNMQNVIERKINILKSANVKFYSSISFNYTRICYYFYVHYMIDIYYYYRTYYAQIKRKTEDHRSLLSHERFQLFRRRMYVFFGLRFAYFKQGSLREKYICVSYIVCNWIEIMFRTGCMGDAESRFIISDINQITCNHRDIKQ